MQNAASTTLSKEKYSMGAFRGDWNATMKKPAFNAFAYLPIAPPMKPRVQLEEDEAAGTEHSIQLQTGAVLDGPPDDADVLCIVKDRVNDYRGYISKEGSCFNNIGNCIGYINFDTEEAGSSEEEYLGCLRQSTNLCYVEDSLDEIAGTLDMGLATIIDSCGSTVAELSNTGECVGHSGSYLGTFEGMRYKDMKIIALYLILLDPGMLNEVCG